MSASPDRSTKAKVLALAVFILWVRQAGAQMLFWSDQFNGGVTTGSYSLGIGTNGSGTFEMPVTPGSTIHWAYLFGTQVGTGAAPITVDLNGSPYTFEPGNIVGPVFQSIYGGDAMVHGVDVTADLDAAVTNYTITVPTQTGSVNGVYTEFYLYIAFANPTMQALSAALYFTDQDCQGVHNYTLPLPYPVLSNTAPVAFASAGGYAANSSSDCESISINGTLLGSYAGGDFNAGSDFGTSGSFAYGDGALQGLGDDDPDQAIAGTDVLSDVSALVPIGSTTMDVQYEHCPGGTPQDNHIWMMMVAYTSDPCGGALYLGPDAHLCEGESLTLDATKPNATYVWQDAATDPTYTVTTDGTYFVHVEGNGCAWDDTVQVAFDPIPVFSLGNDTTICSGTSLLLDATSVPPADAYVWLNNTTGPTLLVNSSGLYAAAAVIGGCVRTDSITVNVQPTPDADLGADRSICEGESTTFIISPGTASVLWSNGSTGNSIPVNTDGEVWVQLTANGCVGSDTAQVTVDPLPPLDLGADRTICIGEPIEIDVFVPGATYLWSDATDGSSHSFADPVDAWVIVTSSAGCVSVDSVRIDVEECALAVEMPNVFSPNGDAENALFQPILLKGVQNIAFTIWNRWGQEVYTSTDLRFGWNGRLTGGNEVPEGTYFWLLRYTGKKSGTQEEMHGTVTLLR